MTGALIILAVTVIAGIILYAYHRMTTKPGVDDVVNEPRPEGCCGQHEVCEKDSLLAAVSRGIEYYDDEELDRYRGRDGAGYDEEEAEEFRNIFYTMRTDEVAGWVRSLQLRQISLPDQIKDEVLLIVRERREG